MGEKHEALNKHLADILHLNRAGGILGWDQQVNMPPMGAAARAAQLSTLSRITHEMFTGEETQRLLEAAAEEAKDAPYDSMAASLIRVVREDLNQQTKLPTEFMGKLTMATVMAHGVWAEARAKNDFSLFQSTLEEMMDLALQTAEYLGYERNPYDALINRFERGMTYDDIKTIFDGHKQPLVDLISAIGEVEDRVDDRMLHQHYAIDKQREFSLMVVKAFGFDFARGRQDQAVHPFASGISRYDVRITTRFHDDFLNPALFGLMHEAGHGMYEQGIGIDMDDTFLARATSLSVHESQSRMWENIVGRSRGFWQWAYPMLQETFPAQLQGVDLDTFYKAVNKVHRSFIRVEADEATYNLHIMLRFELENDLINGRVKVADLPKVWNERFEEFLGIVPPTDALGVLQDIHWSAGLIGYFPTYALGNLLSVQYYNKALQDHPSIPDEISTGKFDTLLTWLNKNIHEPGAKFTTHELTERVCGERIQSHAYMKYLQDKFSDIYGL